MQNAADILYVEVNLAAILIMVIVLVKSVSFSRMQSQKHFIISLSVQLGLAVTDTFFVMFSRGILPKVGAGMMFFKSLYFILAVAVPYFWFLYFERLRGSIFSHNKRYMVLSSALVIIMAYCVIVNLFSHSLFYINEAGDYERGPWFIAQFLFCYAYVYLIASRCFRSAFRNRRSPDGRLFLIYGIIPLIPALCGYLQFVLPEIPLTNICLAFVTLLLYVNSMDTVVSVDPLTQLFNRRQFMRTMTQWVSARSDSISMYYMIMDVDKFKIINDRYGHTEGDMALMRVADTLRVACMKQHKKATISRYGGDEFVILVEADGEDEVKKLITQIDRTLREKDLEAEAPYRLSLSIGYARLDEGKTVKAIMDIADERQYAVKEIHHRVIEAEQAGKGPGTADAVLGAPAEEGQEA